MFNNRQDENLVLVTLSVKRKQTASICASCTRILLVSPTARKFSSALMKQQEAVRLRVRTEYRLMAHTQPFATACTAVSHVTLVHSC